MKMEDQLLSEYDLHSLEIRKLGPQRTKFGPLIKLDSDVAQFFPDAESVNQALRFLIRITQEKQTNELVTNHETAKVKN